MALQVDMQLMGSAECTQFEQIQKKFVFYEIQLAEEQRENNFFCFHVNYRN